MRVDTGQLIDLVLDCTHRHTTPLRNSKAMPVPWEPCSYVVACGRLQSCLIDGLELIHMREAVAIDYLRRCFRPLEPMMLPRHRSFVYAEGAD